ncbi:MAG: RNA polymerase sigma-70 factor [Prevotellaceae bacterium]|jgi:RNA polymerase sigma-70 factor (ECF subfamily)|nr:RNA polymerase sigma-70 factor [Prevotellaceae bacterium]
MSDTNCSLSKEFEAFFIQNYPKVKNFARRLLMREQDAEDVAQDIFLKIAGKPAIWQDPEQSGKYLFTMTKNYIFNIIKHRKIERKYENIMIAGNPAMEEFGVTDKLYAEEIALLVQYTVEQMPPQRRDIFKMSRVEGMSNALIAEKTNLSVRTVERHLYLALKELKKRMRQEG